MALIKCPECGKEISDKALSCPNCGFPMNEKQTIKVVDGDECPICKVNKWTINQLNIAKCVTCGYEKDLNLINKSYNRVHCPTCGSKNVQKITTSSKIMGAALFGILSITAKSQYKCNDCNYKW